MTPTKTKPESPILILGGFFLFVIILVFSLQFIVWAISAVFHTHPTPGQTSGQACIGADQTSCDADSPAQNF